jgi:hypothetical protein
MLRLGSQRRRLGLDRPVPAGRRAGGRPRTTDLRAVLTRSFTCCEPVASGAWYQLLIMGYLYTSGPSLENLASCEKISPRD